MLLCRYWFRADANVITNTETVLRHILHEKSHRFKMMYRLSLLYKLDSFILLNYLIFYS